MPNKKVRLILSSEVFLAISIYAVTYYMNLVSTNISLELLTYHILRQ